MVLILQCSLQLVPGCDGASLQGGSVWTLLANPADLHVGLWVWHRDYCVAKPQNECTSWPCEIVPISPVLFLGKAGQYCMSRILMLELSCPQEQTKEKNKTFSWMLTGYFQTRRNFPWERSQKWSHFPGRGMLISVLESQGRVTPWHLPSLCLHKLVHSIVRVCVQGEFLWQTEKSMSDIDSCWNLAGSRARNNKKLCT